MAETIDVLIRDADWVLTMDPRRRILRNASIAIRGDRIVAVGKTSELDTRDWEIRETINGSGRLVVPGFVETHIHNSQHWARGLADECEHREHIVERLWVYEDHMDEEDFYWASLSSQLEMLKAGATCFLEIGNHFPHQTVRAMAESGMRGVVPRNSGDISSSALGTMPGRLFSEQTDDVLRQAEDFVKQYHYSQEGRVHASFQIRNFHWATDALITQMHELAQEYNVGMVAHALASNEQRLGSYRLFGGSEIKRLERLGGLGPHWTLVHMGWVEPDELPLLLKHDVKISLCPGSSFHQGMGSISNGKVPEMLALGISVGLGSDSGGSGNFLDMVRQMYLVAGGTKEVRLNARVVPPETALEMATIHGARAAHWEEEIGSIEVGKKADLTIFDTDRPEWHPLYNPVANLVYCAHGGSVDTVLVDGKILMKGRQMTRLDEERILAEVKRRSAPVAERANLLQFGQPRWPIE